MSLSRVASRCGNPNRLSAGQNLVLSRHVIGGPSFVTRRANAPAMNLSSSQSGPGASNGSFAASPKALALGAVFVAGFAAALYSTEDIRLDTTKAYNPDAAWSDAAIVKPNMKSKALPKTLHEGLTSSAKPSSESIVKHGTEDRSYDLLSPEQVTKHLSNHETSTAVNKCGVLRYDTNQVLCNEPLEDDHDELIVTSSGPTDSVKWAFWAIYDGHSGWATAAKLRQTLIPHVYHDLAELYNNSSSSGSIVQPSFQSNLDVIKTIQSTFLALDYEIVWSHLDAVKKAESRALGTKLLAPALSGSCALLAFYDTTSQLLRVACTGDCRAVLGRRVDDMTWSATPLSSDQTGANPDEAARIRTEHPGEEDCVANGRLLGYEPSRVFGDATLKWSKKLSQEIRKKFYGKSPSEKVLTPPYATAEPVVTTTKIHPEKGDFVVMACDGLWEMLSNEEVVALVAEWIDKKDQLAAPKSLEPKSWWSRFFGGDKNEINRLPYVVSSADANKFYREAPVRPRQWQITPTDTPGSKGRTRQFVVQDANVATHLIRNGLGGGDHDLVSSLLMLEGKNARRFRDDLTVTVIFFGPEADNNKK
ncbi:phosphatase 2C-like domain-containing protein [Rhypophila decipiens]|uniref:Phosphatase 2C-like domain-containing protein n=1 Tax=Rhypophila decipiens TaxID=261697 RepID=A0AAN6Y6Y3_9PEZI|nr:phosphatase 2C-like domain-containing protein [Rhypophila decipiens]